MLDCRRLSDGSLVTKAGERGRLSPACPRELLEAELRSVSNQTLSFNIIERIIRPRREPILILKLGGLGLIIFVKIADDPHCRTSPAEHYLITLVGLDRQRVFGYFLPYLVFAIASFRTS